VVLLLLLASEGVAKLEDDDGIATAAAEGLPSPHDVSSREKEFPLPKLDVGGKLTFDSLGPIIINSDGTLSRIANFDKMTNREQEMTLKRIRARNKERQEKLLEKDDL